MKETEPYTPPHKFTQVRVRNLPKKMGHKMGYDKKMPPSITERHFQWRWADSNRRPNNLPKGFLHAYPFFDCREQNAGRQAI